MSKKGKVCYVPKIVIDELDDIMQQEGVNVPGEAWHRLAERSKEAKRNKGFEPPILNELKKLNKRGRKKNNIWGNL